MTSQPGFDLECPPPLPNPQTGKMNARGCPGLQNFYTCSAGDFKGCCSVNPCDTGVCPDGKASNENENTSSSSDSSSTSTSTVTAGKINGPLVGTTATITAAMSMSTDTGMGGSATTTNAGAATTTTAGTRTTQPQAGTVWSIPGGISGPSPRPVLLGTPSRPDTITTITGSTGTSTGTSTSTNPSTNTISISGTTATSTLSLTEQLKSATSSPDTNPNTSSSGGNNKAIIGGVVGGILALGVILAIVFVLFCRRKKKRRRRRFTLLAWHGPQHNVDQEKGVVVAAGVGSGESLQAGPTNYNYAQSQTPTPISTILPATSLNFNTHTPTSTTRLLRTSTLPSPAPSFTSPSPERRHRHPLSPILSIPSNPSLHSTLGSKHDIALDIGQDLGVHPALRGTNTETERAVGTGVVTGTRTDPETTPELGDTGFYRQRAELATYSQSELINIPHERRHPISTSNPTADSPSPTPPSSSPDNSHKPSGGTKIITPDGVLLSANFERFPGCEDYATSFAQCFDRLGIQLVEEVLPAYRGCEEGIRVDGGGVDEKRESDDGGDLGS